MGIISRPCSTDSPRAGAVRQGRCQIRDTVPPTLVRSPRRTPRDRTAETLERGTDAYPALGQDDAVTSGQRGVCSPSPPPCVAIPAAVPPSRALQHHPWHCGTTGRRDIATPATVRLPALCQHDPRADVRTTTKREAPTPLPSKPLLDRHRTRRDAPPEARFARTVTHSTVLYTILPHVA
jgi:hypothetical protein